jgi:hypothetical protein
LDTMLTITVASRYIQKFYQMRTQLQAISLRIQVYISGSFFTKQFLFNL